LTVHCDQSLIIRRLDTSSILEISRAALEAMAARDSRMELHIDPPNIARLMTNADIAIGAGGTTTWERCCLGLPTIVLGLADNQVWASRILDEFGAINALEQVNLTRDVAQAVTELSDPAKRREMSLKAANVTDGRGKQFSPSPPRESRKRSSRYIANALAIPTQGGRSRRHPRGRRLGECDCGTAPLF
jgi:predicted glycosyltransferase